MAEACKLPRCTPALRGIGKQSYEQRLRRLLPLSQISRESEIVGYFAYSLGGASVQHERARHDASCTRDPVCCCRLSAGWGKIGQDGTRRDGGHAQRAGRNNASCTFWPSAIARMHEGSKQLRLKYSTCTLVPQHVFDYCSGRKSIA